MHIKTVLKKSSFFIIILCCMLIGSIGYAAVKKIPPQESLASNPNFPQNESGETYGSSLDATPYEKGPDLIKAIGVDGTIGYVRATELEGELPKSPEEALAMQAKDKANGGREISLYKSDGKTIIGKFKIQPGRVEEIQKEAE